MTKNDCEVIRQQLEELMLDEAYSPAVAAHLDVCVDCREFHETRTKLRRMVGSLGTVAAPPDFDFRLRARLASDSNTAFHLVTSAYWSFARRTFAVAAALIVLATGVVVVRNVLNREPAQVTVTDQGNHQLPAPVQTPPPKVDVQSKEIAEAAVPQSSQQRSKSDRSSQVAPRNRRPVASADFSSQRAEVINGLDAVEISGRTAVFPIDASLQSLKVSLDDGRGNARTISVPTIRFGSQRMLPNANQFAQKGIW